MTIAKRKLKNFNPFQYIGISSSAAVDYNRVDIGYSSLDPWPQEYQVAKEYKLFDKPTESPDSRIEFNRSDDFEKIYKEREHVVRFKSFTFFKSRFIELQKWEGTV